MDGGARFPGGTGTRQSILQDFHGVRAGYRNFFYHAARRRFSGLRLAEDA